MPYIDSDYYLNNYKGKPFKDENELNTAIQRASDLIDILTEYKISVIGFDNLNAFIKDQVKKAVAAQVNMFALDSDYEKKLAGINDVTQVRVGNFSYNKASQSGRFDEKSVVNDMTIAYLSSTGLLYTGIGSI